MKAKENRCRILDYIFILVSCEEMVLGILHLCKYEFPIKRYLLWGFLLVYLLKAMMNRYSRREKIIFAALMVLGGILYFQSGINIGIKAPIYIFALKGIDIRKLFKGFLLSMVVTVSTIMLSSLLLGGGTAYVRDIRSERGFNGVRYCLGFTSPNITQYLLFIILVYLFLIYEKKMNWIKTGLYFAGYLLIYYFTNSYTGLVMGVLLVIIILFGKKIKLEGMENLLFGLFVGIMCLFLRISLLAASRRERGMLMEGINYLISGRMDQLFDVDANNAMYAFPGLQNWHLFSDKLNKNWFDLGYVQIFYYYGIVMGSCYLLFVAFTMWRARVRKDVLGMSLVMCLCIYLFMESRYFSNYLTFDFLLMVSSAVMWGEYNHVEQDSR